MFETLGDGVALPIPDFADDDNPDQALYASVNLVDFIPGSVNFNLNEIFDITNGTNPNLPGMYFGTSELSMDPGSANGFDNVDPFTGSIIVTGENDPSSTPLPSSLWGGLALFGGLLLHRLFGTGLGGGAFTGTNNLQVYSWTWSEIWHRVVSKSHKCGFAGRLIFTDVTGRYFSFTESEGFATEKEIPPWQVITAKQFLFGLTSLPCIGQDKPGFCNGAKDWPRGGDSDDHGGDHLSYLRR